MNDHDLEQAFREWARADTEPLEPPRLRSRVMAVPESATISRRRWLPSWSPGPRARSFSGSLVAVVVVSMLAVVLLPVVLLAPSDKVTPASPATITVAADGSGQYSTINDAVAAAVDGDTVLIQPGRYRESILVDKDITLRGDGSREEIVVVSPASLPDGPVLRAELPFALRLEQSDASILDMTFQGPGSAIDVRGGSPRIENVAIIDVGIRATRQSTDRNRPVGLSIVAGAAAKLSRSLMQQSDVIITEGSYPVLMDNEFDRSMIQLGECCWGGGADPRNQPSADDRPPMAPLIARNIFRRPFTALWVGESLTARFEDNEIVGAESAAVWLGYVAPGSTLRGNVIRDGDTGILVVEGAAIAIDDNTIFGNATGIVMSGSGAMLRNNVLRDNKVGIVVGATGNSASPTLEDNTISGNVRGLAVMSGTSPVLSGNVVCDNETNVVVVAGADVSLLDNKPCTGASPGP